MHCAPIIHTLSRNFLECLCSPRRVAVVRQRDVSGAQLVDGPEGGEAAVQTVPALDPDQARDQTLLQGVLDACKFNAVIKVWKE